MKQDHKAYRALAARLNSFPEGFPPTEDGKELALLAHLFSPEEAWLAAHMTETLSPLDQVSEAASVSQRESRSLVKSMVGKGLISLSRGEEGILVRLFPFVVGFYENQFDRMDESFAQLFEAYYQDSFPQVLRVSPQFHRVVPVGVSIENRVEIYPEEDIRTILSSKQAWGVLDCVCRKQRQLIGKGCEHPVHVCLVLGERRGMFDAVQGIDALDLAGAQAVLEAAAEAGLVHTVSNHRNELTYICSCCTCSCGILRGISEVGLSNVVARSRYAARVAADLCIGCGDCEAACQFDAIHLDVSAQVDQTVCVGCGVCVRACLEDCIQLEERLAEDILDLSESREAWLSRRAQNRE